MAKASWFLVSTPKRLEDAEKTLPETKSKKHLQMDGWKLVGMAPGRYQLSVWVKDGVSTPFFLDDFLGQPAERPKNPTGKVSSPSDAFLELFPAFLAFWQ